MNDFDPYYEWLDILPEERPITLYRLLGIRLFESDSHTITNAADRQMAFLRTFQIGSHSRESQQLLNEVAQARVILLNPEKKSEYDEMLQNGEASEAVSIGESMAEGEEEYVEDFTLWEMTAAPEEEESMNVLVPPSSESMEPPVVEPSQVQPSRIVSSVKRESSPVTYYKPKSSPQAEKTIPEPVTDSSNSNPQKAIPPSLTGKLSEEELSTDSVKPELGSSFLLVGADSKYEIEVTDSGVDFQKGHKISRSVPKEIWSNVNNTVKEQSKNNSKSIRWFLYLTFGLTSMVILVCVVILLFPSGKSGKQNAHKTGVIQEKTISLSGKKLESEKPDVVKPKSNLSEAPKESVPEIQQKDKTNRKVDESTITTSQVREITIPEKPAKTKKELKKRSDTKRKPLKQEIIPVQEQESNENKIFQKVERENLEKKFQEAERLVKDTNKYPAGERMVRKVEGIEFPFHWCPAGSFLMGSENVGIDAQPVHKVLITKGFWILETEVTQAMWMSIMGNNPSTFQNPQNPVEGVSWAESQEFCIKLSKMLDAEIKLPTEAQWEYACKAGISGDDTGNIEEMGWVRQNSNNTTHPVGQKKPNEWGVFDMYGNVWEWCNDYYSSKYYTELPIIDPTGPESTTFRVYRGGGWFRNGRHYMAARRAGSSPEIQENYIGFRVVLIPSEK